MVIGCIELIILAILLGMKWGKKERKKEYSIPLSVERIFLRELNRREDEVYLLIRHVDKMPVYVEGDLYGMLGTTLQRLQADVTNLDVLNMDRGKARVLECLSDLGANRNFACRVSDEE